MKIKTFAAIVAALTLAGCTDTNKATRALEGAGYSQVETTGYAIFATPASEPRALMANRSKVLFALGS